MEFSILKLYLVCCVLPLCHELSLNSLCALLFRKNMSLYFFSHRVWRYFFVSFFSSSSIQQQSARYFSPHERSNTSPTAGNLTVLNSPTQCYPPSNDNLFHRPSCLTCPTTAAIGDHNDHPSALPVNPHFNSFHHQHHQQQHNNMHGPVPPQMVTPPNKNLIANSHATAFDSCET